MRKQQKKNIDIQWHSQVHFYFLSFPKKMTSRMKRFSFSNNMENIFVTYKLTQID